MAAVSWDGGAGTLNWHDAANWSGDVIPGINDDVLIVVTGSNPEIAFSGAAGARAVRALVTREPIRFTGGSLRVVTAATLESDATATLQGGELQGGVWSFSGLNSRIKPTNFGGTLRDAAIAGDFALRNPNARLQIVGSTSFNLLDLASDFAAVGFAPGYVLNAPLLMSGPGTGFRLVEMNGQSGTLTIGPSGSMRRTSSAIGTATIGTGNQSGGQMMLINNGIISNDAAGLLTVVPHTHQQRHDPDHCGTDAVRTHDNHRDRDAPRPGVQPD